MKTDVIKSHKALFEAWNEYVETKKAFTFYLTHVKEEIFHSNAPSNILYDFARTYGLKVGILWDERQALSADFTEFKIFLYHSFIPKPETKPKWDKIEEEIIIYVQEKLWYDETPNYHEAYDKILKTMDSKHLTIVLPEVNEYDSLLRAYIETPLKTDLPNMDKLLNLEDLGYDF